MIRQQAFGGDKRLLKGALHCHTTRSDGRGTPAEVIDLHRQNGYDFMALTDHRNYNYKNWSDRPMLIVPGMEMDADLPGPGLHCHHIVCIGPAEADGNGFHQDERFDSGRSERPEDTQKMLDWIHGRNNMTVYCHPEWSGTPARDFEMLRGNFAMEIWNSGCAIEDRVDMNAAYWDELLMQGQVIYGVATDDGHAMEQHCKGWVMVNAEPELNSVLAALKAGRFYSSCGPEIHDFWLDDEGVAHIDCSPVSEIQFINLRMPYHVRLPEAGQTALTHADMPVRKETGYIRASVIDAQGRRAWTNPIFFDGREG